MGYIKQEDLPALYSAARLFCYISLYEGFGLPPLEALACGTPVLTSCIPVFQEVLGAHAYYVDPADIAGISRAIVQSLEASPSSKQDRILWASKYSWHKAAKKTFNLFQNIT